MSNNPKTILSSNILKPKRTTLQQIFPNQHSLGWQILDAQSHLYSEMDITMDNITCLTALYMKIIQKLNSLHDPREGYFTFKMQKLMSQPYIIRCFNGQHKNKKAALENRRKELEQKFEKEAERQNNKVIMQKTLEIQKEKEERLRNKIKDAFVESDKKLQQRIRKRTMNRLQRSMDLSPNDSLNNSVQLHFQSNEAQIKGRCRLNSAKSSDFQMLINEESHFRQLRYQIEEEEQEEKEQSKIRRQMDLWQTRG